jgi:TolA-binding protein
MQATHQNTNSISDNVVQQMADRIDQLERENAKLTEGVFKMTQVLLQTIQDQSSSLAALKGVLTGLHVEIGIDLSKSKIADRSEAVDKKDGAPKDPVPQSPPPPRQQTRTIAPSKKA